VRLDGSAPDLAAACRRFDATLAAWGGIDLAIQTVGINGHFGFNEPGATVQAPSRVVALTGTTRESNSVYWPAGTIIPPAGLTLGVAQILAARHIVLLAYGAEKAPALARALLGPIDAGVPCSLLRLAPHLTVIADATAARDIASTGTMQRPAPGSASTL
jgi:glucosamine-6-phosphate deaminase